MKYIMKLIGKLTIAVVDNNWKKALTISNEINSTIKTYKDYC